jgi:hypothetical protein
MQPSKTWFIAIAAASAGAVVTHVSWLVQERDAAPRAAAADEAKCESRVEQVCLGGAAPVAAARAADHALRAGGEPAATPAPAPFPPGKGGDWNPIAQLSSEQRKTMVRHQYGELLRELALSPVQAERLMHALSEQEARNPLMARGMLSGATGDDEAALDRQRAEITAAIGEEKAAAFEELREMLPVRSEVRRVRDQLEEAGEPVTSEQYRALMSAMKGTVSPQRPPSSAASESWEETAEAYHDWMNERDDMFRESAAKILSPTQLKTLDEGQELREAMRLQFRASFEAQKAQTPSGG